MSFRMLRGCSPELIFEHYRKRTKEEERFPEIAGRFDCRLTPASSAREKGTIQCATATGKSQSLTYVNDGF
jgi:hypothetical protein